MATEAPGSPSAPSREEVSPKWGILFTPNWEAPAAAGGWFVISLTYLGGLRAAPTPGFSLPANQVGRLLGRPADDSLPACYQLGRCL